MKERKKLNNYYFYKKKKKIIFKNHYKFLFLFEILKDLKILKNKSVEQLLDAAEKNIKFLGKILDKL